MKTKQLVVLALSLSFASAFAQSEEQILNSDPINVDGYLAEERPVTDGELEQIRNELKKQKVGTTLNKTKAKDLGKLTNQTEKLLDSQDEYIDSKIESSIAIKEFNKKFEENQKKLNCIMEESNAAECEPYKSKYSKNRKKEEVVQEIKVAQAAPVVSTAEVAPMPSGNPFETIKLLPFAGGTTYSGERESLEASLSAGLKLESNINNRFSVGLGLNYAQLRTEDFANSYYGNQPWTGSYYNNYGQQGREMQFNTMGLELYGKFFITQGERFRPYLGAGLGINRSELKYSENNPYSYSNAQFGDESYKSTYFSGNVSIGSEIMITRSFGINIEAQYSTGLGSSLSSEDAKNPANSPDQARLRELGDEIINANALSIFAGAVVMF